MATLEENLTLLATTYGRHPQQIDGLHGFATRGQIPEKLYGSIKEAVQAEAGVVRQMIVVHQRQIAYLDKQVNAMLVHIGMLER